MENLDIFDRKHLMLYNNGFGFQYDPKKSRFIIAKLKNDKYDLQIIKILSESVTLEIIDCFGHDFLVINKSEYDKIDDILYIMSCNDIKFETNNELHVPSEYIGVYTRENMEIGYIKYFNEYKKMGVDIYDLKGSNLLLDESIHSKKCILCRTKIEKILD
jgi:hypothetical protein